MWVPDRRVAWAPLTPPACPASPRQARWSRRGGAKRLAEGSKLAASSSSDGGSGSPSRSTYQRILCPTGLSGRPAKAALVTLEIMPGVHAGAPGGLGRVRPVAAGAEWRPMGDWNFADVREAVAAKVPDAPGQFQGERVVSWRQF